MVYQVTVLQAIFYVFYGRLCKILLVLNKKLSTSLFTHVCLYLETEEIQLGTSLSKLGKNSNEQLVSRF